MKKYIGTKIINAKPMNRLEYNNFRGWTLPEDENGSDEGYLVEYKDGGKPNTTEYSGYVSWSPKEQFENAYKESGNLSFGDAIAYLKLGFKVARAGWNGKGMWLILQTGSEVTLREGTCYHKAGLKHVKVDPHIDMFTAAGTMQPGWLASQADILSDDWQIIK